MGESARPRDGSTDVAALPAPSPREGDNKS